MPRAPRSSPSPTCALTRACPWRAISSPTRSTASGASGAGLVDAPGRHSARPELPARKRRPARRPADRGRARRVSSRARPRAGGPECRGQACGFRSRHHRWPPDTASTGSPRRSSPCHGIERALRAAAIGRVRRPACPASRTAAAMFAPLESPTRTRSVRERPSRYRLRRPLTQAARSVSTAAPQGRQGRTRPREAPGRSAVRLPSRTAPRGDSTGRARRDGEASGNMSNSSPPVPCSASSAGTPGGASPGRKTCGNASSSTVTGGLRCRRAQLRQAPLDRFAPSLQPSGQLERLAERLRGARPRRSRAGRSRSRRARRRARGSRRSGSTGGRAPASRGGRPARARARAAPSAAADVGHAEGDVVDRARPRPRPARAGGGNAG